MCHLSFSETSCDVRMGPHVSGYASASESLGGYYLDIKGDATAQFARHEPGTRNGTDSRGSGEDG
jgi:hypothetical protein